MTTRNSRRRHQRVNYYNYIASLLKKLDEVGKPRAPKIVGFAHWAREHLPKAFAAAFVAALGAALGAYVFDLLCQYFQ